MDLPHVSRSLSIVHPLCVERGRNAELWDEQGRHYIDFVGGIGVLNLGHGHPAVVEAVKAQVDRLMHSAFNALPHRGYLDVVEALDRFVPVSYPLSCMLTNSGAEATENALKVARAATGRQAVIAFDDGFHGRTLAALNLNGKVKPYKSELGSLPGPVYHLPFPSRDSGVDADEAMRALDRLFEVELPAESVAAIIVEPVQGEGGFRLLDADFAARLRERCDAQGIVLIFDEIQSGFGRSGTRFALTHLGVEPDLLLMGKSMAAGLPLAAVAGRAELMDALPKGGLGGTYSGNPVACAAARTVMEVMSDARLSRWSETQEALILEAHTRLAERFPMVGALTGIGTMRGIVFEDTSGASGGEHLAALLDAAREAGVLLMPSGRRRNVLRLLPPLTAEPEVLREGFRRLEQALETLRP
ncbi:aspartate aminotransferase family protein [Halomonas sp. KAO]|uniref:2-aminoadipate transaminase n=1 Tax=unclassified Halomonas TaxID=2609666 RepID=UPI00189F9902|nr:MULTISPECIES: aspartate aminotransferase family protein [unclassified Halomonas]MBF7054640.1 aspartate aminotransferase family protein [Halomonas sp. KAO]MDT0500048.1 aspartate aminotransferase family protein [Halomonas sp. PAR7]MDT0512452.1 aspartate aminotransferase family protein [Halomonas sp. LES1]MDT0591086.1 aspartate aminotransferase family protein [Halomonas sp. PAR8]